MSDSKEGDHLVVMLADPAGPSGFDALVVAGIAAAGVIVAALIAGFVSWRSGKKSPHERLKTLVSTYATWPEALNGTRELERPISVLVEQVRLREGISPLPTTDAMIVREARTSERRDVRDRYTQIVVAVISALAAIVVAVVAWLAQPDRTVKPSPAIITVVPGTPGVIVGPSIGPAPTTGGAPGR